ncbi:LysR family transcriptional regulator [Archangium primigenium]|uniref:LysR family transcriptional regulator n=1 Tax=[Archangium] primigenium TaxID=2792470 RepID=UPI00195CB4CD|nr:LysR family transcriptional regulator [Archangium primigenium]MBM7115987.1 LysR family transcriptional regulator [Archangium primigenium]
MRLDLDALKIFVRVAELRSFTQAAHQLGMPKARASAHVQKLEAELGTQLLQRSTRVVRPTPEGEQLLKRAPAFLAEAEEISALFHASRALRGRVRVELPVIIARDFVMPRVPELLARHPQLQLDICASDRLVAAVRDGFDLVLRVGLVNEPGLVGRRIGEASSMNCASPAYLRQHGTPRTLDDLRDHFVVHYATDPVPVFEYIDGPTYKELPMRSMVTVDNFDVYEAAGLAGLGIVQVPRSALERHANRIVEILPEFVARPVPITLLHTHGHSVPRRVRAVMTWLMEVLAPTVNALMSAR